MGLYVFSVVLLPEVGNTVCANFIGWQAEYAWLRLRFVSTVSWPLNRWIAT